MGPKVIRIEIKVTRTMATVLVGLLVALALLAMPSAGAHPPLEGPGGQGGVTVASSVPTMINYQGQLLDSGGDPVPNGTYSMTFKLYNVPSGGTAFWVETHPSVQVNDGLFNVLLGEYVSLLPEGEPYPIDPTYLGVTVGSDPEMTPRQQMVSVPYAFQAKTDNDWDGAGTGKMYTHYLTDNVGIGTTNPGKKLDVKGHVRFYDATYPESYALFENNWITLNERRNRNKLWISAYDQVYGNLIYTEDPQEGGGQGFGIAGGSWMAPFDRFVVNTDEMFLGYSILPGDGESSTGGDGSGNLYVRGNVGIGTTDPSYKLHVSGDVHVTDRYLDSNEDPGSSGEILSSTAFGTDWIPQSSLNDSDWSGAGSGSMYATNTGDNVGIGTTSPEDYKLRVNQDVISIDRGILLEASAGSEDLSIWVAGDAGIYTKSNKDLHFGTNNDYARNMTLSTDGNIGIGTTSPQSTLQVEGDPGYLQVDGYDGSPPGSDCNSDDERGRMILDFANNRLYVCTGSGGWKYAELQQ